jgi:hypothetical protein
MKDPMREYQEALCRTLDLIVRQLGALADIVQGQELRIKELEQRTHGR